MGKPVVHFDIGCKDHETLSKFYCDLFDWSRADYGPLSKSMSTGSEDGINGFITSLGHEPHNYCMIYVEVDDVDAYAEKITNLGGSIMVPPTDVPTLGRFSWAKDPEGTLFGLWQGLNQ